MLYLADAEVAAVCDIVAATNIETISLGQWSCDSNGVPLSPPCSWDHNNRGMYCYSGNVVSIDLNTYGLTGKLYL